MLKRLCQRWLPRRLKQAAGYGPSESRREANDWIRRHAADCRGRLLSVGSGSDEDGQGGYYRDYFQACTEYVTSEIDGRYGVDWSVDVRDMAGIEKATFDGVFCSGVLEHVDDFQSGLAEIHRILKPGGILLLGLPFRQALHLQPHDYWRFTEHAIRYLLEDKYAILALTPIDTSVPAFPNAYWTKARKK